MKTAGPNQGFPFKELDLNPAAVYTKKLGCLSGSGEKSVGTVALRKKMVEKQCNWIIRKISSYMGMIRDDPILVIVRIGSPTITNQPVIMEVSEILHSIAAGIVGMRLI